MQITFNFSPNTTLGIASIIRVSSNNKKITESYLSSKLLSDIHCVNKFFDVKTFSFKTIKAKWITVLDAERVVVYCQGLEGLFEFITDKRQVHQVQKVLSRSCGQHFK